MTTFDQLQPTIPPGAARWEVPQCTDWQLDGEEVYRIVYTEDETIADCDAAVHLSAIQHPDGNLSDHDLVEIYLDIGGNGPLSADQSRALARILLDAVEQAEHWAITQSRRKSGAGHSPA